MNINTVLLLLVTFGCALTLTSCKKDRQQTVIVEKERVSGPFGDDAIEWNESDYK
jgi:hypothetical protein